MKEFFNRHAQLPVPGSLPDMKAKSDIYIRLQGIYKAKARKDAAEVLALIKLQDAGSSVTLDEVELFCKNAAFVRLVGTRCEDPSLLQKLAGRSSCAAMMQTLSHTNNCRAQTLNSPTTRSRSRLRCR